MPRIAILDDYMRSALAMADWTSLPDGYEPVVFADTVADPDLLVDRLRNFEIVCAMRERTPFPAGVFERLENLKLFNTAGMRNAAVDVAAARARGIVLCGTGGSPWVTAEHTWGLLLACARHIPHDDRMMRANRWQTRVGVELRGRTLGILGLGRIGGQIAHYAKAFGMEMIAWSKNLTANRCAECGAELVTKEELFRRADFVTIHLLLSSRTRDMVGSGELALMKSGAFLINTSRGPIVNEDALIAALRARKIQGAGVDVYDREPMPWDHPLRALDNLVMTPHTGYVTEETYRRFYGDIVENIQAWHDGAPIREIR